MTDTLPPLEMRFAAGSVKHFGLHMYSTAVPAIAETVANAWDADASAVGIVIPFGAAITADMEIVVSDNGCGMSYDDCLNKYLIVGRDRRVAEHIDATEGGRGVMGHKGLGKFAPFGIANVVDIRTVHDGRLTHFRMDYRDMVPPEDAPLEDFVKPYFPAVIAANEPIDEPTGTRITMGELRLKRAIGEDVFRRAMSRRFTCIGTGFVVKINESRLPAFDLALDLRIPTEGMNKTELGDEVGTINWWVGFTPAPIAYEELRGVSVVARGKLVQNPFFFNLSGGITGQAGLQYMTGVVEADWLDQTEDLIATDRSSVLWELPRARELLDWGKSQLRSWLQQWLERRAALRLGRMKEERPALRAILDSLDSYPKGEKEQLTSIVTKLATTVEDDDELDWAVGSIEGAFQDRRFIDLVRKLDAVDEAGLADVIGILKEYEVLESIRMAQLVAARIEIIRTFRILIEQGVREKPEMQDFIMKHPWLLDPAWQVLRHEAGIDTVISRQLRLTAKRDAQGRLRLDFFCLADSLRVVVVELKRPGRAATADEWEKFVRYVATLTSYYGRLTNEQDQRQVQGLFVASELDDTARRLVSTADGRLFKVTDWDALLRRAESMHRDYLGALTADVSASDPRLRSLRQLLDGGDAREGTSEAQQVTERRPAVRRRVREKQEPPKRTGKTERRRR